MSNLFDTSVEESVRVLKRVLPLMSEQKVPTIPQNYTVWYDYVTHENEELCDEIDRQMKQGAVFTPDICRTIYERHFLEDLYSEVDGIQGVMQNTVDSVLGELAGLGSDFNHFSEVLAECGLTLSENPSVEEVKSLIVRLAQETHSTRERSDEVESSFQSMAQELTVLRTQVDRLSRDSRTDALTGVANRRAFDQALVRLTQQASANNSDVTLIMLDIDHFKLFNDRYGHTTGDRVLRFVAQEMEQCVKGRDLLARYGGEEFAVLLPSTPYKGAYMLAESIRSLIEAHPLCAENGEQLDSVTISLGVATYRKGEDPISLLERADACLYEAKQRGRNRVTGEADLASH